MLPEPLQTLAFVFPAYHLGQPSLAAVGRIAIGWGPHMGMLLIFILVFGQLAAHGLRRGQT